MAKQEILNKLIDSHEERVIGVLKKLEDDIIADLTKSTAGGEKLTTQLAVQLRPNLKRLIEENYLSEVDDIIRSEYDEVIKEYQKFIKPLTIPARQRSFMARFRPILAKVKGQKNLSPAYWAVQSWKKGFKI